MKLIIQIPCLNERETLATTLADLPRQIAGIDQIETLVIDDGSSDGTAEAARVLGVDHVVRFPRNRGLARAFMAGLDACLRAGADIIVNTDADNQYLGADIPRLVQPILDGQAELVVGDRQTGTLAHFSPTKRLLQGLGSWVVRQASRTDIPDTTSGFRALSRHAAMQLFVHDEFTYTLETIIQAGTAKLALAHVPIGVNPKTRESRLFRSIGSYLRRSATTIVRVYTMYKPLRAFGILAAVFLGAGLALAARFLYFYLRDPGYSGHVQSLILAAILLIIAFQVSLFGLLADLVGANRRLLEESLLRLRRLELGGANLGPAGQGGAKLERAGDGHGGAASAKPMGGDPDDPATHG